MAREQPKELYDSTTLADYSMKIQALNLAVVLLTLAPGIASSGPIAQRLATFVGKPVQEVEQAFGKPSVVAPHYWQYSYNDGIGQPGPSNLPNPPEPVDNIVNSKGQFTGVAPSTNSSQPKLPCSLNFEINDAGLVVDTEHHGPGCFEIVYSRTISE